MKNLLLTLLVSVFFIQLLFAQKFGDVEDSDVQMEQHPSDESADAAYLIKSCHIKYDFNRGNKATLNVDYHFRIKIFKESAEDRGNFSVGLYDFDKGKMKLRGVKGYTFNWVNGKKEKVELESDDIFEEETSESFETKKWAMPAVKAGSVIDVKYTVQYPTIFVTPKWFFQSDIPVDFSEYSIEVPEFFTLTPIATGTVPLTKEERPISDYGFVSNKYTYTASNVPALKDDDFVLNIEDFRSSIKYELYSVTTPGSPTQYFSKDWAGISNLIYKNYEIGKYLEKDYDELEDVITRANEIEDEAVRTLFLFQYVRDGYQWNESFSMAANDGLKNIIETKSGSVGEMNMLLANLLYHSGISVTPIATKTRGRGMLNSLFPSFTELDYLIVAANLGEQSIWLDVTSKNLGIGLLPLRAVNLEGLEIKEEGGALISLTNPNYFKDQVLNTYSINFDKQRLEGSGNYKKEGYSAYNFRINKDDLEEVNDNQSDELLEDDMQSNESNESEDEELEEDIIIYTEMENLDNKELPVKLTFNDRRRDCVKFIGDQIFINADFDQGIARNPFEEMERDFPVFYNYNIDLKRIFFLNIPEGYQVESTPEPVNIELPDQSVAFKYSTRQMGNKLQVTYAFAINKDRFLHTEYEALRTIYNMINDKQDEMIVLSKME